MLNYREIWPMRLSKNGLDRHVLQEGSLRAWVSVKFDPLYAIEKLGDKVDSLAADRKCSMEHVAR